MKRIISLAVLELVSRYVSTSDTVWYIDDIVDSVQVVVLCSILAWYVRHTVSKWCLVVAYGACEFVEMLSNIAWYAFDLYNPWLDGIRVFVAVLAISYYRFRRYDIPSAPMDDSYMYLTYRRPRSRQDRLISLVGLPLGGVGVYCRGQWYRYHRGVFIISKCKPCSNHVIIQVKAYEKDAIHKLEEMAGTKWGILNNCITEILPVMKLGQRLPFLPKPHY